jgi:hypothetical protein
MWYTLLERLNYIETQGYGKTEFAKNARMASGDPYYENAFHAGRDIVSDNRNARALTGGRIKRAGLSPDLGPAYGKTIEIDLPTGDTLYYAHLKHIASGIAPGVEVQPNDTLGVIGGTVYREGRGFFRKYDPHIHLAAKSNTSLTDPKNIITTYMETKTNDLATNADIDWSEAVFTGQDFVTRLYENVYFLMTRFPRKFIEEQYDPLGEEYNFRKFVEWWAAYKSFEEFKEAIQADFSSYRNS